jgi:hypothetical protein
MTIVSFLLISLAVWRVSNMLADTDQSGPGEILDWLRAQVGVKYTEDSVPYWKPGSFASGLMCVRCSSVWFGFIAAVCYIANSHLTVLVALPFALSGAAILLQSFLKE